ncbi:serine-aspartate repeat-containing protein C-like [Mytilus trossulus]|uniref:serine-aspartate repeat-containing protein C-like n=1 Tax=Mytilus trossulus TaxID=6551 RepID=UPI003004CB12
MQQRTAHAKKHVINLSKRRLSNQEYILLAKGLKFIPTPSSKNAKMSILKDYNEFARKLRCRYMFSQEKTDLHPFRNNTGYKPASTCHTLENYIELTKLELSFLPIERNVKNNLTKGERIALSNLKNDETIVIKKADKNSNCVILDRLDYITEVTRQLNTQHYCQLDSFNMAELKIQVIEYVKSLYDQGIIDKISFRFLTNGQKLRDARLGRIYILPKIHRLEIETFKQIQQDGLNELNIIPPGRPIISQCGSVTELIGHYVDYFLIPIVQNQSTYIKDTTSFINIIEKLKPMANSLNSCHSQHVFRGFIKGEAIRQIRNTSDHIKLINNLTNFKVKLLDRGYDNLEIDDSITDALAIDRTDLLQQNKSKEKQSIPYDSENDPSEDEFNIDDVESSTPRKPRKPGERKTYDTLQKKKTSEISNERRKKSTALRGIKQQFKRLKELKHLNVTFAFVCFDLTQQSQTIKRDGKGAYYDNLLNGRPIVDKRDIQRKKQRDGLTETYFPHEENLRETQFITPTKLSCGPGVSRNIAREQMETLQDVNIQPGHENDSYSHDVATPKRKVTRKRIRTVKSKRTNIIAAVADDDSDNNDVDVNNDSAVDAVAFDASKNNNEDEDGDIDDVDDGADDDDDDEDDDDDNNSDEDDDDDNHSDEDDDNDSDDDDNKDDDDDDHDDDTNDDDDALAATTDDFKFDDDDDDSTDNVNLPRLYRNNLSNVKNTDLSKRGKSFNYNKCASLREVSESFI